MNARGSLEVQLERIGVALRSRPSVTERVMTQVSSAASDEHTSLEPTVSFFSGRDYAKYEYRGGDKPIGKLPLGEADAQKVLPLEALTEGRGSLGPWLLGTEAIIQQQRRDVTENGKNWIDFRLTVGRGSKTEGTLRVDPKTKLPVYLHFWSPANKEQVTTFEFDYPAEGPGDIYALGVPRDIKIDTQAFAWDETVELLKGIAVSRAKIGKFRLIVGHALGGMGDGGAQPAFVVSREGDRWRIDGCFPAEEPGAPPPPEGAGWDAWANDVVRRGKLVPLFSYDGQTIWENVIFPAPDGVNWQVTRNASPQSLLSGEGLGTLSMAPYVKFAALLYPELTPVLGWSFELDSKQTNFPGLMLVKSSAAITAPEGMIGHEWYSEHGTLRI